MPHSKELLHNIETTEFMSTLDLIAGHFQIIIKNSDFQKTYFIVISGMYAFKRIPFGIQSLFRSLWNTF